MLNLLINLRSVEHLLMKVVYLLINEIGTPLVKSEDENTPKNV